MTHALLMEAIAYADAPADARLAPEGGAAIDAWVRGAAGRGDLAETALALCSFARVLQENGCARAAAEILSLASPLTPHLREMKVEEAGRDHDEQRARVGGEAPRAPMADEAPAKVRGTVKRGLG